MNNISKKGFTSLSALLLTSLLVSLGGVGTAFAFQQSFPDNFREGLNKILGKINHVDEISAVFAVTPTQQPIGAIGTTGVVSTITPTPKPTGTAVHDDEKSDDLDDVNEDTNENELDDDYIQHATVVTGQQPSATGNIEERHSKDKDD
jgi:hypothetical protein